ncbi:cell division initiation protein [Streptomyces boluensis]|uniref:Cell division initiation protein n=1 Tax=Streptomyces boluensis TaxID=1775135 RepID=A0A964XLZ0_9ACTN|nr:cell division initiation protein [Streptomyces boluensis]NBE53845.1 cell division initiation protein [Streptomyces boluensis]
MDVQKKLDEIVEAITGARSMPMSASCVINRAELLAQLEEVRQALPGSLAQAQQVIGGSEQLVEQARQEAERIIDSARVERGSLVSDTAVARQSQDEADRIRAQAREEAEEVRQEADEYVDSKLANFEVVLTKTLGSVGRGREKLLGTGQGLDAQGYEDPDFTEAPERSHDPETLRRRADEYVDVKLGAFEAVLSKTLDAVGRGRQKLHGRIATDDLGQLGGVDDQGHAQLASDADFLADLAEPQQQTQQQAPQQAPQPQMPQQVPQLQMQPQPDHLQQPPQQIQPPQPPPPLAAPIPAQQQYAPQDPYGYQQQDPYAYQQPQQVPQEYAQQDPYVYQQQDPYGYQQQNQHQGYGQQGQGFYTGGPEQQEQAPAALDETSLFDTSMISVDQLRQYEQERGQGQ